MSRRNKPTEPTEPKAPVEAGSEPTDEERQAQVEAERKAQEEAQASVDAHNELREKARTEYGLANADDLSDEEINDHIKAIDKQATDAQKEAKKAEKEQDEE